MIDIVTNSNTWVNAFSPFRINWVVTQIITFGLNKLLYYHKFNFELIYLITDLNAQYLQQTSLGRHQFWWSLEHFYPYIADNFHIMTSNWTYWQDRKSGTHYCCLICLLNTEKLLPPVLQSHSGEPNPELQKECPPTKRQVKTS